MKKKVIKFIACVVAMAFIAQDLAWADPDMGLSCGRRGPSAYDLQVPVFTDPSNPEFARHFLRTQLLEILATGTDLAKLEAPLSPFFTLTTAEGQRVELQINPAAEVTEGGVLTILCSVSITGQKRREFTATVDTAKRTVIVNENGREMPIVRASAKPVAPVPINVVSAERPAGENITSAAVKGPEANPSKPAPASGGPTGLGGTIGILLFLAPVLKWVFYSSLTILLTIIFTACTNGNTPDKGKQDGFDSQGNYLEYYPTSHKLKRITYANGDVKEYAEEPGFPDTGAEILAHSEAEMKYIVTAYETFPAGGINKSVYTQTSYAGDYSDAGLSKGSPTLSGVDPGEIKTKVNFDSVQVNSGVGVTRATWKEDYSGAAMFKRTTYYVDDSPSALMYGLPSGVTTVVPDNKGIDRYEYDRAQKFGFDTSDREDDRGRVLTWRKVTPTQRGERVFFLKFTYNDDETRPQTISTYSSPNASILSGITEEVGTYEFSEAGRVVSFRFVSKKFPDGSYRQTYIDEGFYPASPDMFSPMGRVFARFFTAANAKREIAFRVMEYFDQTDKKQRERSFADEAMTKPLFDYIYNIDGQLINTIDLSGEGTGVTINYTVAEDNAAVSVRDDKIGLSFNRVDGVISYTDLTDQSMSSVTRPGDARYLYFASLAEDKLWHALKQAKGTADETRIRTAYQTLYDEARKFFPLDTGKDIWLGVNYMGPLGAQSYGQDFGSTAWYPNGNGISAHAGTVASDLEKMVSQRISRLRMWLICDGRALLDENSKVVGYNALYRKDIKALLDTAHAKGLRLELSLFDFYIADTGQWNNGVYMGGRKELFTDAGVRKKFINDFFVPFIKEFGRHPALQTIDLGNEMGFVQDLGVDPIPLLKELAIQIRKYAPHLKITINLRTDQVQDFSGLMPQIDFLAVHSYPDVTPSLDDIKGYLDGLSIPWGLGEVPSANPESSILDYYKEGVNKKAWYMSPWNWNPDLDDACFPDAATRDAAFEEIRQWNILRNTPVPQGVAKADVTAPAAEIPAHAFRPVSFYSIIGLGGGADWTVYGTAGAAWMTISAISHWQSGISAFFLLFGALVAAVLATTAAIRVYRSVSAIRAAHTDFSLWRALTHDIGHDMTALAILRNTAPNVWFDIQSHESYGYHVPGLLAFIPSVHSNKRVSRMDAYLKDIRTKRETGGSDAGVSPDRTTEIRDILGKIPAAANANAASEREAAFRELENMARSLLVEPQVLYSGANVEVVTNAGRLDIVPDIHADYDALIEHLKARGLISIAENGAIVFNITRGDVIVFQGDITGRGTQDVEVIQLLMRFKAEAASVGARAVFAEGNHDYYLRLLFRRISEIHDKGERVDLERAKAELNRILFFMGASSMIIGVEGFLNRLYRAYRPNDLQGKFKSLRYGDFYAAYSGMIAGGVIDHYNDLKRLVVVDNHVITHTLLPSSVDNYLKRLKFDPEKLVDKEEFIGELGVLDAYLGDLYDNQLVNFSEKEGGFGPEAAWLYYTKVVRRGAPDEMRAIRDRLYSFLRRGLPLSPDVPFRMFIGHDPDLKAVTQDNERSGGKDLVLCDGGMSKCFRDRGMNGGIVEVSPLGKVIAHQPLRREGKEAAVVVFETASDKASELMPSENADVQRLIARIRDKKDRRGSPATAEADITPVPASPLSPELETVKIVDGTNVPDSLIIPVPVGSERPVLTDFKEPKALAHNTIAVMLSVALSGKRPVLAFHKDVSGKSEGAIKTLLGRLEDLKNKEGFDKILSNMVIIKSFDSADDLRKQLDDKDIEADNENNAIFTFSPAEGKSIEAKAVHDVVINEGEAFNADIYYYPLFEIVTMALVKYLRQYNPEQLKSILAGLNITAEDINISDIVEDGRAFLVFKLVPNAERFRDGADRYALLRKYISSAA